ncbi:hypothetical protein [Natronococcus pandeyae]|uniref:hypothetical protein n=1 Tax=Natronococcus pandeyae TaxID=2055836 RepID=UPI0016532704|nr:hypothetical protein [Natronococcus pandeyae]
MKASMEGGAPANPFDGGAKGRLYDALVAADGPEPATALADRASTERRHAD